MPSLRLEVLDILSLIEHHIIPLLASKSKVILNDQLVGCDTHVKRIVFGPSLPLHFSFFLRSKVGQNLEGRAPSLELHLPVDNQSGWYDNQMRSPNTSIAC